MQGPRSYGDLASVDQMIDLGRVKQKCTNMQWWVPRVHQLLFYGGASRTGQDADKRKKKKEADKRKQNSQYWRKPLLASGQGFRKEHRAVVAARSISRMATSSGTPMPCADAACVSSWKHCVFATDETNFNSIIM